MVITLAYLFEFQSEIDHMNKGLALAKKINIASVISS